MRLKFKDFWQREDGEGYAKCVSTTHQHVFDMFLYDVFGFLGQPNIGSRQ